MKLLMNLTTTTINWTDEAPWNVFLEVTALCMMVVVGLVGNLQVIRKFLKVKSHFARQVMVLYFTLAISDGLICGVRIPVIIYGHLRPVWEDVEVACVVWRMTSTFIRVIILKNLLLALQRLVIMDSFPLYRKYFSVKSIVGIVISIWVLQVTMHIVMTMLIDIRLSYENDLICDHSNGTTVSGVYVHSLIEVTFGLVPVIITVGCHMKIVCSILRSGLTQLDRIDERAAYIRINLTVMLRSVIILVCWMPFLLVNMVDPSLVPFEVNKYLDYLLCLQSVISPLITLQDSDFSDCTKRRKTYTRRGSSMQFRSSFRRSVRRMVSVVTSGDLRTIRDTDNQ